MAFNGGLLFLFYGLFEILDLSLLLALSTTLVKLHEYNLNKKNSLI